jgi:hypothetical protein
MKNKHPMPALPKIIQNRMSMASAGHPRFPLPDRGRHRPAGTTKAGYLVTGEGYALSFLASKTLTVFGQECATLKFQGLFLLH